MFHAGRDMGALSADQLLENERTNCAPAAARHCSVGGGASSRPVAAARLARVHVWHASPHGGNGTLRTAASAPRPYWLVAMPRLARHATPAGGGTPCALPWAMRLCPARLANNVALILMHTTFCYTIHSITTSNTSEYFGIEISIVSGSRASPRSHPAVRLALLGGSGVARATPQRRQRHNALPGGGGTSRLAAVARLARRTRRCGSRRAFRRHLAK